MARVEIYQGLSAYYLYALVMSEDSSSFIEKMMELGIGLSMVQQMPTMINSVMPQANQQNLDPTPPPVQPLNQTYLAVDNSQAGPFSDEELVKLIQGGILTPEVLVWKSGMAAWTPADQVPDVNKLFILSKIK